MILIFIVGFVGAHSSPWIYTEQHLPGNKTVTQPAISEMSAAGYTGSRAALHLAAVRLLRRTNSAQALVSDLTQSSRTPDHPAVHPRRDAASGFHNSRCLEFAPLL